MKYKILKLEKRIYPVCPECGKHTIVLFSPPKRCSVCDTPLTGNGSSCSAGEIHTLEFKIDWNKANLYCCNAETNCKFKTKLAELTTPLKEPK